MALPSRKPAAIAPRPGTEDDYDIEGPCKPSPVQHPGLVSLDQALPQLTKSVRLRGAIQRTFGRVRAKAMLGMMRKSALHGDDGDAIRSFLEDGMANDYRVVSKFATNASDIDGTELEYPLEVQEYHGIYQVWALEDDTVGPFLSIQAAESYIFRNWDDVLEGGELSED